MTINRRTEPDCAGIPSMNAVTVYVTEGGDRAFHVSGGGWVLWLSWNAVSRAVARFTEFGCGVRVPRLSGRP